MPSEENKISKFNQYLKSDKTDADLQCLIEKTDGCKNNPENPSTAKVGEHISWGFSMFTTLSLTGIENKNNVYGGKECVKKNCEFLRILKGKNFTEFSTKIHWKTGLAASDVFHILHNQLSSFNSIIVQMSEERDSSNRQ